MGRISVPRRQRRSARAPRRRAGVVAVRKRRRARVRALVYLTFIVLIFAAALAGMVVNGHLEQVWQAHWQWLESQYATP